MSPRKYFLFMVDEPAPEITETPEPEQPTTPPTDGEPDQSDVKPIDSFAGLQNNLKQELQTQYQEKMGGFLTDEPNPELAAGAAHIIAQHTFKHLPAEGEVTHEHLSQAITSAQTGLADKKLWFYSVLPSDPIKTDIAKTIASRFTPEKLISRGLLKTRGALSEAVADYKQQVSQSYESPPEREALTTSIQTDLKSSGITNKKIYEKTTNQIVTDLDKWTFSYQATPSPEVFQSIIARRTKKHIDDPKALAKKLTTNSTVSKFYQSGTHNRHLVSGKLLKSINKLASSKGVLRARKLGKALNFIKHPMTYIGRAAGKVATAPIRFIARPATKLIKKGARQLALKTAKLAGKALVKVGLGGLVKNIERVALAGTGVGIPLLIAQEAFLFGLGNLNKARKSLANSWKEINQAKNVVDGTLKSVGATVDTLGAGVGGSLGAVALGTIGAIAGGLIGSAAGPLGTIVGGVIGAASGGVLGAGVGANLGAKLRKRILKMIAARLTFSLLIKSLLLKLKALIAPIIGGAVGGTIGFLIAGPVGAVIGAIIGVTVASLIPKAAVAAKQLAFIAKYYTTSTLLKASTAAKQLIAIAKHSVQSLISKTLIGAKQLFVNAGQFISTSQGALAQTLRSIGRLLSNIPSSIAKAFNIATAETTSTASAIATKTEVAISQATTLPPSAAVVAAPLATVGLITFFSLITYSVLITAFHVTPTEVTPFFEDPSKFIKITKEACVEGMGCGIEKLENPETRGYDISYQIVIRISSTDSTINILSVVDEYNTYGENNPPTPATIEWTGIPPLPPGGSWTPPEPPTVSIAAGDNRWFDSLLTNTVTVNFTVGADSTPIQARKSLTIIIGDPPFCPPSLSPFGDDPYYISGYRWDPARHTGVDLASSAAAPWSVYSTHNCMATVAYATPVRTNCFGTYVVLQSGPYFTFAVHLTGISVNEGDTIGPGHVIGEINGATTGCSTGPHDHYEIRMDPGVVPQSDWQPHLALNPCDYGINCS